MSSAHQFLERFDLLVRAAAAAGVLDEALVQWLLELLREIADKKVVAFDAFLLEC